MKTYRRTLYIFIAIGITTMIAGCSPGVYTVPDESIKFVDSSAINLSITLKLSNELCTAKWVGIEHESVLHVGNALCANSIAVSKAVFTDVEIAKDNTTYSSMPNVKVILTPTLITIERDRPMFLNTTQTLFAIFNWTLTDTDGGLIWASTIEGEGEGAFDPFGETGAAKQTKELMSDIFQKSFDEMSNSNAIRSFADKQH